MLPTLLDIVGARHPARLDGRSFLPLIRGGTQTDREHVFKEYNENSGASRDPMRAVQTKRHLYIFNPWSNGERVFATATTGTVTYRRMAALAKRDDRLAKRLDLYRHRVPEELYDVVDDPDCLHNLIAAPEQQTALSDLRSQLEGWMVRTKDPMLAVFQKRDDAAHREAYVQKVEREAIERRKNRPRKNKRNKVKK
jgi:N-sulfoglucosamine sulfohydrolase